MRWEKLLGSWTSPVGKRVCLLAVDVPMGPLLPGHWSPERSQTPGCLCQTALTLVIKKTLFFSFFIYLFGYLWHVGFSSPARDGTVPPALEAWNLNHWTTGKSQSLLFNALKSLRIWGWLWFLFKPNITHDLPITWALPKKQWFWYSLWHNSKESACQAEDVDSVPGLGRSPRGGNGNPCSILAWRIPWTEEPGELQFMGSHRVGCDQVTNTFFFKDNSGRDFFSLHPFIHQTGYPHPRTRAAHSGVCTTVLTSLEKVPADPTTALGGIPQQSQHLLSSQQGFQCSPRA